MNIVVHDPSLNSLLSYVNSKLSPELVPCLSFRKYEKSFRRSCGSCPFCAVSSSLLEVASLICRILGSGYHDLNVFLVLDSDKHQYSTFMLDYLRSLYALVIHTYSRYKTECGLYVKSDSIGILNPTTYNLNLLPVYDWRRLLNDEECISVFKTAGTSQFLLVEGCKYIFKDFYAFLKPVNKVKGRSGLLASCSCTEEEHRISQLQRSALLRTPGDPSSAPVSDNLPKADSDSKEKLDEVHPVSAACDSTAIHDGSGDSTNYEFRDSDTPQGTTKEPKPVNKGCNVQDVRHPWHTNSSYMTKMETVQVSRNNNHSIADPIASLSSITMRSMPCESTSDEYTELHHNFRRSENKHYSDLKGIFDMDCLAKLQPSDPLGTVRDIVFFDDVICCGTFDCLHFGHKYLLLLAFLSSRKALHVGVTGSDNLLHRKSNYHLIQSYAKRVEAVDKYLRLLQMIYGAERAVNTSQLTPDLLNGSRVIAYANCDFFNYRTDPIPLPSCEEQKLLEFSLAPDHQTQRSSPPQARLSITTFKLMDVFGPAGFVEDTYALVISPESLPGAEKVNEFRCAKGLLGWPVLSGGFVMHPEFDSPSKNVDKVSSSSIRSGMRSVSLPSR